MNVLLYLHNSKICYGQWERLFRMETATTVVLSLFPLLSLTSGQHPDLSLWEQHSERTTTNAQKCPILIQGKSSSSFTDYGEDSRGVGDRSIAFFEAWSERTWSSMWPGNYWMIEGEGLKKKSALLVPCINVTGPQKRPSHWDAAGNSDGRPRVSQYALETTIDLLSESRNGIRTSRK